MSSNWTRQKAKGSIGEQLFKDTMLSRKHTVIDVRDDKEYQTKDVDFIVSGFNIEVKTDYRMNQTGNIFLEDVIEYWDDEQKAGWFKTTTADYLSFVDGKTKDIHIYKTTTLRDYIKDNRLWWNCCNDGYKRIYGYCLSVDVVPHQIIEYKE